MPDTSLLYIAATATKCEIPGLSVPGDLHWTETEPTIVPRLPLPPDDWYSVKTINDYFRKHIADYGGQVRFFWKSCAHEFSGASTPIGALPIAVPISDPLLDIRPDVASLSLSLRLPTPVLSTLPEPDVFYGLKVNNPAWIAVTPGSWQTITTPTTILRGWPVTLTVRPVRIEFAIDQGGRVITVPCDPAGQSYTPGSKRFPTEPAGFTDQANWLDPPDDPLPSRECTWTPRAKGPGTVTVAVTYDVTAVAGGFLFQFAPRTNTATVPIEVSELRVVNLRP